MRFKHCTDEQLLAYLDGELGLLSRLRCVRHLRKCWGCREQLWAVEKQIERLARLAREEQARFCPEAEAAKRRFLASIPPEPDLAAPGVRALAWPRLAASLGLGALAFAAGISYWHHTSGPHSVVHPPPAVSAPPRPLPSAARVVETPVSAPSTSEPLELQPQPLKRWAPESLAEAELEAVSVLCAHAAQAFAAFSFERDPVRGLRIEGVVEDQSRKDILLSGFAAAVRSAPWSANLTVAAELRPAVLPDTPPPEHTVRARSSPAEAWLQEALQRNAAAGAVAPQINAIVNGALRHAGSAAVAAWTLRRLMDRFPDSTVAGLSPRGREVLARIVTGELSRLREALASEREWMGEQFPDAPLAPIQDIFKAVSEWERLVNILMTCCDEPPADTRAALRSLAALLNGIENHLASGDFLARHWPALAKELRSYAQASSR